MICWSGCHPPQLCSAEFKSGGKRGVTPRRGVRVAEGARLESVLGGNSNVGSYPTLSAISLRFSYKQRGGLVDASYADADAWNQSWGTFGGVESRMPHRL